MRPTAHLVWKWPTEQVCGIALCLAGFERGRADQIPLRSPRKLTEISETMQKRGINCCVFPFLKTNKSWRLVYSRRGRLRVSGG